MYDAESLMPQKGDLLLEAVCDELAAVVVSQDESPGHILGESTKTVAYALTDWPQRFEPRATFGGMDAKQLQRAMERGTFQIRQARAKP